VRKSLETKVPGPFRSVARKFQGARRPGSEWAEERKDQGAKVIGSELARVLLADSLQGANWPGSEIAVNQMPLRLTCIKYHISSISNNTTHRRRHQTATTR